MAFNFGRLAQEQGWGWTGDAFGRCVAYPAESVHAHHALLDAQLWERDVSLGGSKNNQRMTYVALTRECPSERPAVAHDRMRSVDHVAPFCALLAVLELDADRAVACVELGVTSVGVGRVDLRDGVVAVPGLGSGTGSAECGLCDSGPEEGENESCFR